MGAGEAATAAGGAAGAWLIALPQLRQNLAVRRLVSPQFGQSMSRRTPHWSQNEASGGLSVWHCEQIMAVS